MPLLKRWWSGVLYVVAVFKSPFQDESDSSQRVLDWPVDHPRYFKGPSFEPSSHPEKKPFQCEYPTLQRFVSCSTPGDRSCWLRGPGKEYNIHTNYETEYPEGIIRPYTLEITEETLNPIRPDGVAMPGAQLFNKTYPGPWIEACWGDILEITVKNKLPNNGTTIHWHGIRQLGTIEMDGVNAVTQCPIAPGDQMTYRFRAMQYGTSWYHSHYSLEYAVGLAGPLTIHGPSSGNYHEAKDPILMTDWSYRSAFDEWAYSLQPNQARPAMKSILLNGKGQYVPTISEFEAGLVVEQVTPYTNVFERGKRYLLRLINTAADATFIFSIDHHNITVVGSDFVPIHNYTTNSVLVSIGQRYHIVVEANPLVEAPGGNYWIRSSVAKGCSSFSATRALPDERNGILRYDAKSPFEPLSKRNTFPTACSDEPYDKLRPILEWHVNAASTGDIYDYNIGLTTTKGAPYYPADRAIARWDLTDHPMWLNMSRPTITNLNTDWNKLPHLAVVTSDPKVESWIEMLLTINKTKPPADPTKVFIPLAHPIHLHGHDFALLAQSNKLYNKTEADKLIKRDNPPRRDVALVPAGGYIIIAFKADNPGVWLMHCHIAFHASSGLALQIIENNSSISIPPANRKILQDGCAKWDKWFAEHDRPDHPVQDDSAI